MAPALALEDIRPLRRAEYDKLIELGAFEDEKIELLKGVLIPMSPIGPRHSSAVDKLAALFFRALDGRATVRIQNPFAALDDSEPDPDVAIVPLGDYDAAHPDSAYLIVEVAESSLRRDRDLKLAIYAECRVPEYWIVNLVERHIEVYSDPHGSSYRSIRHYAASDSIQLTGFADVRINVSDVVK